MRTEELRSLLHDRGDEVHDVGTQARVGAVHERVRTFRRRRAAAAGGGVLAAVAAIALAVVPGGTPTPGPAEVVPGPSTVEGYTKDGVTLPDEANGRDLLGALIGDPGESELWFTVPAPDADPDLQLSLVCYGPAAGYHAVSVAINGTFMFGQTCDADRPVDPAAEGYSATAEIEDAFAGLGLTPGEPMMVEVWLRSRATGNDVVEHPDMVVGAGVYGRPAAEVDPVAGGESWSAVDGYTKDGLNFPLEVAGEALMAAEIGDPGESMLDFDLVVPDGGIRWVPVCYGVGNLMVEIAVDGHLLSAVSCRASRPTDPANGGITFTDDPTAQLRAWGLRPGDVVPVRVRLIETEGSRPVRHDTAVIGAAVYEDLRERSLVAGAGLPDNIEHAGRSWDLEAVPERGTPGSRGRRGNPSE
jgi:hypothetical protein